MNQDPKDANTITITKRRLLDIRKAITEATNPRREPGEQIVITGFNGSIAINNSIADPNMFWVTVEHDID